MRIPGTILLALLLAATALAEETAAPQRLGASDAEAARAGVPYRMFAAWLDTVNSSDASRQQKFLELHYPGHTYGSLLRLRENSGGLDVRALDEASATTIAGVVQERDSDNFLQFKFVVQPDKPELIDELEILYVPRPADFPPPRMSEAQIFAALGAKLAKDSAADRFAGAVLVTKNGKVVFRGAYGLADRERKVPNRIGTRFDIGSMNKMFTATAILQLVQAGRIHLADPVGKYLPDYPNRDVATKVTIEHLLTHTGGTGNIFGPDFEAHRLELKTHDDYVKLFGGRAPLFEPGDHFDYSNYGMVLLGAVIEKVTGRSYYDYVRRKIYRPASMKRTGSEPLDVKLEGTAIGYMRTPEGRRKPSTDLMAYRGSAGGGGFSTVVDLTNFATALMDDELLNAENTQLMTTGKVDMPYGGRYAYGFEDLRESAGYFGHGGAAPGVNGTLRIFPKSGYIVAVLSNIDPPFADRVGAFLALRLENRLDPATASPP
jgi:CubicO group peptidase (beta-lactamase class C family)